MNYWNPLLVNPPVCSPFLPTANLAILKGSLEGKGVKTKVIDANLEFFLHVLSYTTLEEAARRIDEYANPIGSSLCSLIEEIGANVDFVRTPESIYEPLKLLEAYNSLNEALVFYSRSFQGMNLSMKSLKLAYDRKNPSEILAALEDNACNPFPSFFRRKFPYWLEDTSNPLIGISISFQDQLIPAFSLAREIRTFDPEIPIVLGGQIVTRCADNLLSHEALARLFDALVLYEGEVQLCAMAREHVESWQNIPNVVQRVGSHITDKEAIGPEYVVPDPEGEGCPSYEDLHLDHYLLPISVLPIQMSRGCYYGRCKFCAIPSANNSPYRWRCPETVFEDMRTLDEMYRSRYGQPLRYFKLVDSSPRPDLILGLSELVSTNNANYKWECYARLETVFRKEKNIRKLYEGGCRKVYWGLESAVPEVLKSMRKGTDIDDSSQILHLADRAGILNFVFVMLGFPSETEVQIKSTVDYIITNRSIHTATLASFDLTRHSTILNNREQSEYGITTIPAEGILVRLPYLSEGEKVKWRHVRITFEALKEILDARPDILAVSVFNDSLRTILCDHHGNHFGRMIASAHDVQELVQKAISSIEQAAVAIDLQKEGVPTCEIYADKAFVPTFQMQVRHVEDILLEALCARLNYQIHRIEQL